jgi:pilus assembly protein CpaE
MTIASVRHKALVVCPQRQMMVEVLPLLASAVPLVPLRRINNFLDKKDIPEALAGFDARLCFLDFSSNGVGGFQTLEALQAAAPQIAVVALLASNNPELVLSCLRAGAAAFVVYPFTPDQIEGAVEAALRRLPSSNEAPAHARVIGVVPTKGGSGATTISCNLAWQCKRLGVTRVLLCDLDPLTGTISFLLKLKSTFSFVDVLHRSATLDDDLWKQMVAKVSGVDILLSPECVVDPGADLPPAHGLTEFAGPAYDAIVADMSGPFGSWNLSIARLCNDLLLVSTNDIQSLHATQRAIAYLEAHKVGRERFRVVINRYSKDTGLHVERIAEALGIEPAQIIPNDPESVSKSLMDGKPIPHSTPFGKALSSLVAQLELKWPEPARQSKTSSKAMPGLLSSMFSRS